MWLLCWLLSFSGRVSGHAPPALTGWRAHWPCVPASHKDAVSRRSFPHALRRGWRAAQSWVGVVVSGVEPKPWTLPLIPASAGALIRDRGGRLLILNPTYKEHWTIPGGQVEADGETPWEACRRETLEECALEVVSGRLVCVDFLRPCPDRTGGLRFLFDCGVFDADRLAAISLQAEEISEYRLAEFDEARELLSGPVRRRVGAALAASRCVYLEDGRPIEAVGS